MSGTEPITDPNPVTDPPAASPGTPDADTTPTLTQKQFNAAVAEERRKWEDKAKRDAEKAAAVAAENAAAEQGEFKKLAEQRAERIVALETQARQLEAVTTERDEALAEVDALVEQELQLAPEFVRDAIAERNAVGKLRYLRAHRDKWTTTTGRQGVPATPRANGTPPNRDELIEAEIAAQLSKGRR